MVKKPEEEVPSGGPHSIPPVLTQRFSRRCSKSFLLAGQEKKGRTSNKVFRRDIGRNFFTLKADKQRSRLPEELMPSPSL